MINLGLAAEGTTPLLGLGLIFLLLLASALLSGRWAAWLAAMLVAALTVVVAFHYRSPPPFGEAGVASPTGERLPAAVVVPARLGPERGLGRSR